MATLKKPTMKPNFSEKNYSTNNIAKANFSTDNLGNNNYLHYSKAVNVNKLKYRFVDKPAYVPSQLQQDMDRRMEYSFDYNNANEVNSYADVIMKTLTNVGRTMRGMKTINDTLIDFGTDTYNLFYRGTYQPIINKDWGVLLANSFVNFRETVDLVDNVWKGFAIGGQLSLLNGGNFDWEGAKSGMRRAVVDRENFDFDTGNKMADMALEMATPTNIALLLLSGGSSAAAKKAMEESGEQVGKGIIKSFGKNYTSAGLDATFKAMGRNLTKAEIASLTNISKHVSNLRMLSGVNKMKKAIDIIDKAGPMLAWKGTVGVPWGVIKATTNASNSAIRYFATAVENVQAGNPDPGLISTLAKRPEYELLFDNMGTAFQIAGEADGEKVLLAFDDIMSGAANLDNNKLKNAYNFFFKTSNDTKLVQEYVEEMYKQTGKFTAFEVAQKEFRGKNLDELVTNLNQFAFESSGKMYKTFDEYANMVNILAESAEKNPGLMALHETIQNIEKQMHRIFIYDTIDEVQEVINNSKHVLSKASVTKQEMHFTNLKELNKLQKELANLELAKGKVNINDLIAANPKHLDRLVEIKEALENYKDLVDTDTFTKQISEETERLENLRTTGYIAYQKAKKAGKDVKYDPSVWDEQLADLPKKLVQNAKDNEIKLKLLDQQEKLQKLYHTTRETISLYEKVHEDQGVLLQKIDTFRMDLVPDGFTYTPIDPIETIDSLIKYSDHIEELVVKNMHTLSPTQLDTYDHIQTFLDYAVDEVIRGSGRMNLDAHTKNMKSIADYGRELTISLEDIQIKLDQLPEKILENSIFGAGTKSMSKNMYGASVLNFARHTMDNLEKQFSGTIKDSFKEYVKSTFYKDGVINEEVYSKFLADMNDTIELFSDNLFKELGEFQSDTATFADMTFEFAETAGRVRSNLMALVQDHYSPTVKSMDINVSLLHSTLEDLSSLKYHIDRTMKKIQPNIGRPDFVVDVSVEATKGISEMIEVINKPTVDGIRNAMYKAGDPNGMSERLYAHLVSLEDMRLTAPDLYKDVQNQTDAQLKLFKKIRNKSGVLTNADLTELKSFDPLIKALYDWDNYVANMDVLSKKVKVASKTATDVADYKYLIDAISELEQSIGITANIDLEFSKDILTEYTLKFNTTLKNMHLLQNEELIDMLSSVRAMDYKELPVLESLESMSRYNTGKLSEIRNIIDNIDFKTLREGMNSGPSNFPNRIIFSEDFSKFNKAYIEYFGRAFDPLTDSVEEFVGAIDTIFEVQKAATTMMDTLHGMVSVVEFYDSVNLAITKGMDESIANTFLDAIQRTYDNPASLITLAEINNNPELLQFEYSKIFQNMEMQLRNQSTQFNMKLSNWYDWFSNTGDMTPEDIALAEQLFGTNSRMHHTAIFDAWTDSTIHKYLLQDGDAKNKYFAVDVEASGTNKTTSTLFQKSVMHPETGVYKWYINSGVSDAEFPDEDHVMHLLFGDGEHHLGDINELKDLFRKIYQNPDKVEAETTLRTFFGIEDSPIEIIIASSEADLLKQSSEYIATQKPPRGKLLYRMHNGMGYDMPLINNRARYHGVDNVNIGAHKVQDTQILLEEALGVRKLTANEMGAIEDLVYKHIVRRNAELSAVGLRRQLGTMGVHLNENLSKFLPTMDKTYLEAHDKLIEIFDKPSVGKELVEETMGVRELFKNLTETTQSFYDDLKNLELMNKQINKYKITVNVNDLSQGNRILPLDYGKNIPTELLANHVGMDLATLNTFGGVYIPVIGVNKHIAPNLAHEYFDTGGRLVTERNMKQMTQLAGNIQRTISYINNPHAIDSMDLASIHKIHDMLLEQLKQFSGESYFDPVLMDLKKGDTPLRAFATTNELFKMYNRLATGVVAQVPDDNLVYRFPLIKELIENSETSVVAQHLVNTKQLYKNSLSQYGVDKLFFTLEPTPGDAKAIYDYWGNMAHKSLLSLEELENAQDKLQFTRLKRVASVYRGMQDSFNTFHEVAERTTEHVNKLFTEGFLKTMPGNMESATYSTLRVMNEAYDSILSFNKLQQVLESSPEQLASFLRHQAKGGVVFQNSSLFSKNYFPRRGLAKMSDLLEMDLTGVYRNLLDQSDDLEKLGIGIFSDRQETIIYINDLSKLMDAKHIPFMNDFDMEEWIEIIADAGLRDAGEIGGYMRDADYQGILKGLREVNSSRANLTRLMPDANTSTLEVLDDIAMERIVENIKGKVPDFLDLKTMHNSAMFEGNSFNHTVLGHVDGRRVYMNYTSFNPAKTMYNATSMVEKHLGAQVQLLELVQTPEFKLENFVGPGKMPVDEAITYLKQSNLKVAFLNDKSKPDMPDFKLSAVTINNAKDMDFALKMGATLIDTQTYNEAYKIVNNYKIRNGFANFIDKAFVAPFKIGWMMWNYGVVARNIVDTVGKNVTTTKDMAIAPAMAAMTKDYWNYKNVLTEIYQYAQKQNIHIDVATNEFFAKNADRLNIKKDVFDLITEYQKAGGSVGMSKEVMEHYGDSIDRMFRKVNEEESGLSKTDFREFMKMPDDVANQWLLEKFPTDMARVELLMDTKGDLLIYKRAYAMHKAYKGSGISVSDLVTYLKSGRIDPDLEPIALDLMEKTKGLTLQESMFTKAMNHPLVANSLDWNMASEEILRLSMFKYMRETGYNTVETMGEIARTHFDYGKKHWSQMYMEMLMPFSTFRVMSLLYWIEEMSNNAGSIEILADAWSNLANLPDRQPEDVMLRRNLRYQMYTGNMILNEETGLTAKINPTPIDMMNFFMNPVEYVDGMLHSGIHAAKDLLLMEPYKGESELSFYKRKQTQAFNMIPMLGSAVNKIRKSYEDARPRDDKNKKMEEEPASMGQFILNLALSPLFNTTWTPEQGGAWHKYTQFPSRQYRKRPYRNFNNYKNYRPSKKYKPRRGYTKRYYPKRYYDNQVRPISPRRHKNFTPGYRDWSQYSTYNKTMTMPQFKFSRGSAYPTKASRSLNYAFSSVWRLSMTKKGNPKYKFMGFPTNKWTLKIKIQMLRNITSYNRWA